MGVAPNLQMDHCIYIYKERKTETETREREHKQSKWTKVWFDFQIRYRGENIEKGSPPFSKN